ncbi:MAG: hypothetical protein NTW96_12260 [Planctomycetia bacterium]|nr:hypothetical protein [Planctomycetia bacterium]
MMAIKKTMLATGLVLGGLLLGCGPSDGLSRAPLTGTVTYHGKPVDHGMIGLLPVDGTKGPQGSAAIGPDGTYEVTTAGKPGAVIGTHKLIVQSRELVSESDARQMKVGRLLTPKTYATYDTTPLKVNVPAEGTTLDIELRD